MLGFYPFLSLHVETKQDKNLSIRNPDAWEGVFKPAVSLFELIG